MLQVPAVLSAVFADCNLREGWLADVNSDFATFVRTIVAILLLAGEIGKAAKVALIDKLSVVLVAIFGIVFKESDCLAFHP